MKLYTLQIICITVVRRDREREKREERRRREKREERREKEKREERREKRREEKGLLTL